METLISASIDLQIVLIAGYLGFKITTVGRGLSVTTEEFLAQTLAFGSIGRAVAYFVELGTLMFSQAAGAAHVLPNDGRTIAIGAVTILAGIGAGMVWRRWGSDLVSAVMEATGTYKDDHQPTTWASIKAARATWTFVQVHLNDGRVLECEFSKVPLEVPGSPLIIADDGVSFYVTRIYRPADGGTVDIDVHGLNDDYVATYVPRSQFSQVDFGWRAQRRGGVVPPPLPVP